MEALPVRFDLVDIDTAAWSELAEAARLSDSSFRYLNLCTVDSENKPQARIVVLRYVDVMARILEFHTDIRSPKWEQLLTNPYASVLGFCGRTRLQLRLTGRAETHAPGSLETEAAWRTLPAWTRATYSGGPPGDERAFPGLEEKVLTFSNAKDKNNFGVLYFRVKTLDWFQLLRSDNRRAMFSYNDAGKLVASQWLNP
ncbi:pyridoxamine 5'-phosphate oxidase family protein [Serratia marcescens]|nr:pyridoxamine 5'-phosphate oxidase family protein [Serratia marcescens]